MGREYRIGRKEKAGYCAIEVGNQFSWTMISTYLSVFYTDVVGIAPAVVSIIFLIARVWDGINDPMMGVIAEKTNTRFGKYRPYLIFGAPLVAVFSILTFSKITSAETPAVIYAAVTYILCGMAYTAVCIAQGSLVNVMTRDSNTRVQLNALRQSGSGITGLVISAIAMPMILYFGNGSTATAKGYLYTTILFGSFGMICVMFGGIVCKENVLNNNTAKAVGIGKSLVYVIKNRNVLLIVVNGVFTAGSILGRMGVLSYWFIYYLNMPELMAPAMVCYNLATILIQFAVPFATKRIDKKLVCVGSYVLQAVSLLIMFAAGDNIVCIYAGSILLGCSNFAPTILYSIAGDIIDQEEVNTGKRSDGIVYSMLSLGTKIGIAVGGAVAVFLLEVIGYQANAEQTAATLKGINVITNLAPVLFVACAALTVGLINITQKKADENRRILEERMKQREQQG